MKKWIYLACLVLATSVSFSQKHRADTAGKAPKVFYAPKNAVKFDIVKLLVGDMAFAYERAVSFNSSIEVELGPTISRYGLNRMNFLGLVANIPNYDYDGSYRREGTIGGMFSIAYKHYLLKNRPAMNGLFIAPRFKFRNYNDVGNFSSYSPSLTQDYKNSLNQFMLVFNLGMNHWFSNSFGIEYYVTFGLTMNNFKYHYYTEYYTDTDGLWHYDVVKTQKNFFNPTIGTGFKLNFGF
ncbi:MAG: hypothetical protein J0G96_03500 [Flavobacteriia bacterium]|nr:hypothetical protein [Flavobacteriia bacterium]OJX39291.1 MAG: hypothetical protein BGO87_04730 [Flavobacteriia bacterium 40-80]